MTYRPSRVPDCLVALFSAGVIVALAAPAWPTSLDRPPPGVVLDDNYFGAKAKLAPPRAEQPPKPRPICWVIDAPYRPAYTWAYEAPGPDWREAAIPSVCQRGKPRLLADARGGARYITPGSGPAPTPPIVSSPWHPRDAGNDFMPEGFAAFWRNLTGR